MQSVPNSFGGFREFGRAHEDLFSKGSLPNSQPSCFSPEARRFLAACIDSVARLELMLLLRSDAERFWSATDVSQELRMTASVMARHLAELEIMGLATSAPSENGGYRYALRHAALEPVIAELDRGYHDRRVSLITQIYSAPLDSVRSFADAFRWRRE